MSFLKDIVDFDDSSDEEEFVAPKRSLSRNPPIREKPGTIHRLSNLDETLRNMPYNQTHETFAQQPQTFPSLKQLTQLCQHMLSLLHRFEDRCPWHF